MLHGGPGLSDYLDSLDGELASGYTVYRYQQRGLTPSTTSGPFSVQAHLADSVAVLDAMTPAGAYVIGHSWGGYLAMHLAAERSDLMGLLVVDPLGAVGDGGEADMARNMKERVPPEAMERSDILDQRAMAGEGSIDDAIEALSLVWPGYFADPSNAPAMPSISISLDCYSETWRSIHDGLGKDTLVDRLAHIAVPTMFVLGACSPIPPEHGLASAALIPGAKTQVLEGCGHFPWIERPGVIRTALDMLRTS
jgi:pimeloyl-ACP methyl ester carboxylesterase